MENENGIKIVIARGDYYFTYAPFTGNKEEDDRKVKRGMLKYAGMKDEEIDRIIDSLEIEMDYGGADGMFDDGPLTPIRLVKNIGIEPPPLPPPPPPPPPPEPEKQDAREPRITMLQQYYGDRAAEAKRIKTFDRFKSNIIKKTIDVYDLEGNKRNIEVYTIEEYDGKAKDSDELLLDGYQTRLERLSRAHQKDFSPYKREFKRLTANAKIEILIKYEEMHKTNPEEAEKFKKEAMEQITNFNTPEFERDVIQALIDKDIEFIETNNYTYNSRQNTAENLKTLGKDGEKSVKAQISDEQKFSQKFGLKAMNALISIRNHTKAPVNKAIGTYVASPIFRALMRVTQAKSKEPVSIDGYFITPMEDILATSQKHSRGMYKNKPSHRYHARKDFFIEEEKRAIAQKMADKFKEFADAGEDGGKGKEPKVTVGSLIRLAIVPRVRAITEYKEGNAAILNAGLYDIEEATAERNSQMNNKRITIIDSINRIASYEKEIDDLKSLARVTKDPVEKEKIEAVIKQRELWKAKLEGRLIETERTEIDSVPTDAISMSQHDKANKANMTIVIRGLKTASRIAVGAYISKYLYEEVLKKGKTPDTTIWIPEQEIEVEVTETITKTVDGIGKEGIAEMKLGDICPDSIATVSYDAAGGNKLINNFDDIRGVGFEFRGELLSGSDGRGFDPTELTDVQIDQVLEKDTNLVSVIQEIMQDKLGVSISKDEIIEYMMNGEISNIRPWLSNSKDDIPMGWWLEGADKFEKIINSGTHTITEEVTKTITKTIPGRLEIIPGEEYFYTVRQLNPVVLAAEFGIAASKIAGINEVLRFTRSQEDIQMRHSKKLMLMAKENQKNRESKDEKMNGKEKDIIQGTNEKDVPKSKIRRSIKPFQRSNKRKFRFYAYESEKMQRLSEIEAQKRKGVTVFERFTGSKKDDLNSGYDENLLGTNDKFETPILKDEGEER